MHSQRTRWTTLVVAMTTGLLAGAAGLAAVTVPASSVAGRPTAAVDGIKDVPRTQKVPARTKAPATRVEPGTTTTVAPTTAKTPTTAKAPTAERAPSPATVTVTVTPTPATTEAPSTQRPDTSTRTVTVEPSTPADNHESKAGSAGDASTEALDADVAAAVTVVEDYWKDIFTGWDVTWTGPSLFNGDGFYDSTSGPIGPYCGEPAPPMNAFYCGGHGVGNGFVAWDRELLSAGYEAFGDSFVYLVVAHEWAHVAQERFIADGEAPAVLIQQELQADCLGGSTLAGAVELGELSLEPGDTAELVNALEAMGDEHPWSQGEDHGSATERVAWFQTGFGGDIESCLGNAPPG